MAQMIEPQSLAAERTYGIVNVLPVRSSVTVSCSLEGLRVFAAATIVGYGKLRANKVDEGVCVGALSRSELRSSVATSRKVADRWRSERWTRRLYEGESSRGTGARIIPQRVESWQPRSSQRDATGAGIHNSLFPRTNEPNTGIRIFI